MRMRFSPTTLRPTSSHMRRICRFLPSRKTKRNWSSFCHDTLAGFEDGVIQRQAVIEQSHALVRKVSFYPHQVFLLDQGIVADQPPRDPAILGEDDQAGRIDVEPTGGSEATQMHALELQRRAILLPAAVRTDQGDRRRMPVFRLGGDIAHGLVQQDGDALALVFARGVVDIDSAGGRHSRSEGVGHHAINAHPAVGNPLVGFAP
jgi:hypothetical protein